jgi:non-specific serine/threonine protein kinase
MSGPVDFAIITALAVERDAVLKQLDGYAVVQDDREPLTYYLGHITIPAVDDRGHRHDGREHESFQVVVIMLLGMGNNEAAIATTRLIERWHPGSVVMVGIAAGVPGEVSLGDVVIADFSWYYELAKRTVAGEQRRGQQFPTDRLLFDRARAHRAIDWRQVLPLLRPDGQPLEATPPKVRFGPIASGEKVVADLTTLDELRRDCPKLMALAMEGAGVARAAVTSYDRPRFLEVRGISDYASPEKNDDWHGFAANAAAGYLFGLLRTRPLPPRAKEFHDAAGAAADSSTPRHNLPSQLTPFIGREKEMAEVKRLLANSRLVTLTGAGGCGKTRLSLQVAGNLVDDPSSFVLRQAQDAQDGSGRAFADGVWLVELASLTDPALVPQAFASALNVREEAGRPLLDTLMNFLRDKSALLVLDNCEHLVEACAKFVTALLRACPRLKVLATSREALRISGETTYRVPSLQTPDPAKAGQIPVTDLSQYEAVRLFADRATAVSPGFAVTSANARAVAQVCHRLDGIPLAIELAAARVKALPVEKIAARLDDRFHLLTGGSRASLPHQQTLRATIDWSYSLLTELPPSERALLRRLSVFAGGWTLEAAEVVCAGPGVDAYHVLDLLTNLVDKSLVVVDDRGDELRYRLLETIREYAREKLYETHEEAQAQQHHLDFFLKLAETAEPELAGARQKDWLDRLEAEHDNLRAALNESLNSTPVVALQLAGALGRFWDVRGYFAEGREALQRALGVEPETPNGLRAKASRWMGLLTLRQGDYQRAGKLLDAGLTLSRALGDRAGIAESLNHLGYVAYSQGDYEQAKTHLKESMELCRDLGDKAGLAYSLNLLGLIAWGQGDDVSARRSYEEGLAIRRELGDKVGVAKLLNNLGALAHSQRDYDAAQRCYEESLSIKRELGDRRGIAYSLTGLGHVTSRQGDIARAHKYYQESLTIAQDLGDKRSSALALEGLGHAAKQLGDGDAARRFFGDSLIIRRDIGDKEGIALCLEGLARVALDEHQARKAARLFAAAEALRAVIGAPFIAAERAEYDQAVADVRAQLDDAGFAAAWAEGREMSLDQAVAYAMDSQPD